MAYEEFIDLAQLCYLFFQNVKIYAVECGSYYEFYQHISSQTFGYYMSLANIKEVKKVLMSICYREAGLESVRIEIIRILQPKELQEKPSSSYC